MLKRILYLGVSQTLSSKEVKRVKVLNLIAMIALFHAVFFLVFDTATGSLDKAKGISLGLDAIFYGSVIYFQKINLVKPARFIFMFILFVNLLVHCNYAFKGFYGEYQYIVIPLFSIFLFDNKYVHYALLVLSIAGFYVPNMLLHIYPEQYFGYLNALMLFVGLFCIVNFFKNLNEKNEKLLNIEKNKVLKDKEILERQQKELKELNDFKSHFFVNLSHEIKTPLTLIKGHATNINFEKPKEQNQKHLHVLTTQLHQIETIISDILDVSKTNSKKLSLRKELIHISSFFDDYKAQFSSLFSQKKISFTIIDKCKDCLISCDTSLFSKAINNIIVNSLKFTPKYGTFEIVICRIPNNDIQITISDTGIGIPKEDISKVFQHFYQAKNHITKSQGSGVGLSFTKGILDAHDFLITLTSTPNVKTTFTITIPNQYTAIQSGTLKQKNKLPVTTILEAPKSTHSLTKKSTHKILLVEDHSLMRDYIKSVLKNYEVTEAEHGEHALEILKHNTFDLIVTDFMMPIMDGEILVKTLKKQKNKTPIIVLTARSDNGAKLKMLRLGIDSYLHKPFIEEELLLTIKRAIFLYDETKSFEKSLSTQDKIELIAEETAFQKRLKNTLDLHLHDKNFGVEELAKHLKLSKSSLQRKLKLTLGQTPNQVITEARFLKAKELLKENPNIKKVELANLVGVYNASYFFKKLEERFTIVEN